MPLPDHGQFQPKHVVSTLLIS